MSEDVTPEDVLGEPAPPPKKPNPWLNGSPMKDPEIKAKALASRKANAAERRRRAEIARADLNGAFLDDLNEMWREHGKTILARAAFAHPEKVAKILADLVPKQMEVKTSSVQDLEDDRLADLIDALSERLGRGAEAALGAAQSRATAQTIDAEVVELQALPEAT